MKKSIALFLACGIVLTALLLTGCQMSGNGDEKEQTTRTVVELNENNYWKYFTVSYDMNNLNAGEKVDLVMTSKAFSIMHCTRTLYLHLKSVIIQTVKRKRIIKAIR